MPSSSPRPVLVSTYSPILRLLLLSCLFFSASQFLIAQEPPPNPATPPVTDSPAPDNESAAAAPEEATPSGPAPGTLGAATAALPQPRQLDAWQLLEAGGTIGWVIMAISVTLMALIMEHLLTIRRGTLMPRNLAEDVQRLIAQQQFKQAEKRCLASPSYLAYVLGAGLADVDLGYATVEKSMEDASQHQAARLYRKLDYFTVIGTISPMLGLLGTVWGMILAFMEFEVKANPQPSELAPGIYRALVTTLQGLCVAIPSLAAYAILRNRVDELIAQTTILAERCFTTLKRAQLRPEKPDTPPRRELPERNA